ncbi:MAG: neutral zinc metallopeptidase [Bacteroidales bacterium]|jgi:predicted metalloprotease|nr:neutral zinc metallopeptidase [Bacteroidales bacterium]
MRWKGRRASTNVDDRRRMSPKKATGRFGLGALVIILLIWLFGGNPMEFIGLLDNTSQGTSETMETTAHEDELAAFVAVVLADTEDVWNREFRSMGKIYREPTLVLFRSEVQTACGFSSAATGPFYCPGDEKIYIDLTFLEDLQRRLNAEGDFAVAYIIAHEVGHHVQTLLGLMDQMQQARRQLSTEDYNQLSVRLELQADFYAGLWANHAQRMKNIMEEGDMDEALNAASAVGDDLIQKKMQGYVVPDSFTHGTSKQRRSWFYKGFSTGDISKGNTFSGNI